MFQYCLKPPNFTFLNLVIPQYNISSNFWNFEYLLNRLFHIFLSENNSFVVTLNKNIQICVPESGHATVKYFIEILNFWMFLKQTLSHIFVSENGYCVLTLYKNTQNRVPESGHATVKYFTETVEFKRFPKMPLSHIFPS